jgi:hypothetical protein
MPDLVTIATGLDLQTAYLARAKLEGSGIYCFLANEYQMQTHAPSLSFAVNGVELRVAECDAPAALEMLTGKKFDEPPELDAFPAMAKCCPNCKGTRISRKRSGWRSNPLLGAALTLFGIPLRLPRDLKICASCGHKWE